MATSICVSIPGWTVQGNVTTYVLFTFCAQAKASQKIKQRARRHNILIFYFPVRQTQEEPKKKLGQEVAIGVVEALGQPRLSGKTSLTFGS